VFGSDASPDVWTKAAALLQSIVKSHPLIDGNERLGWLATATFLELNGVDAAAIPNDAVFQFVMDVAWGRDEAEQIGTRMRTLASG
jgi:death-on-curing protein